MKLWRKWFPPKWKFGQVVSVRKSSGTNWMAEATIVRDGEERLVRKYWKHAPTPAEVKAFAKEQAARRNTGGLKHAFNLRRGGVVIATIHGAWTDDDNFEVTETTGILK